MIMPSFLIELAHSLPISLPGWASAGFPNPSLDIYVKNPRIEITLTSAGPDKESSSNNSSILMLPCGLV